MKKTWIMIVLAVFAIACSIMAIGCSGKKPTSTSESSAHTHSAQRKYQQSATCTQEGYISHYYCSGCEKYFSDASLRTELTRDEVFTAKLPHTPSKTEAKATSCDEAGNVEYWTCSVCSKTFADANCTEEKQKSEFTIAKLEHEIVFMAESLAEGSKDGMKEHYECTICKSYFLDEQGMEEVELEDLLIETVLGVPDFLVEVPTGREPVILQLSDTQIIDADQERPGRGGVHKDFWATDKMNERCFNYLREIVEETNPDFIIITGDLVYGEFDDNGTALQKLITVMESFKKPWSPVFGNHDNESKMGVDWQCEQLEKAKYCYFEQKELSGNGNYSVGIAQGGELKRVFYMMDTNACGKASEESLANGHTYPYFAGFKQDQIDWYTNQITRIKEMSPATKISFAYHIQQAVFGEAYSKYGFNQNVEVQDINIDLLQNKAESDFGYIGKQMKGPWDTDKKVYNGMKALGVDSIFVGHEHCNNASVVYDGIRFQYGQKSSEYDRYNVVNANGKIEYYFGKHPSNTTPLIGGSVIVLNENDGAIKDAYIYYCENAGGKINWEDFVEYDVNGIKMGNDFKAEDSAVGITSVKFDSTTNAYKLVAASQGKALINTELMRDKTTFTFSVFVPTTSTAKLSGMGPFSIRVKPDNGAVANITGGWIDTGDRNKQYIIYNDKQLSRPTNLISFGTWQTLTVDISGIAADCSEFAFIIAAGNTIYLKDLAFA